MLIAALVVVAVLTVPLTGGRWSNLAAFRPRGTWLLWLALVIQIVQFAVVDLGPVDELVHVGTYLLAAAFLALNRRVPGVWLVALGGLSNGLTIALNHGTLPARAGALREAGSAGAADRLRELRGNGARPAALARRRVRGAEGRPPRQRVQRRRRRAGRRRVRRRPRPGPSYAGRSPTPPMRQNRAVPAEPHPV